MMKFIFFILFLIPLVFYNYFWLFQSFFFICTFIFIFNFSFNFEFIGVSYYFGLDLLSYSLILLSLWICSLMIMASEFLFKFNNYYRLFMFSILFLLLSLILVFSSMNVFIFYLFFEVSLIPTLMLIVGWGVQPERIQAGYYLMFYTLFASLPMMISIFFYYLYKGSLDFYFLSGDFSSFLFFLCLNMVFFVKAPMFLVHLWLPKAHVEAPVSGSMILAGVMLKLGGYGMMRFFVLFPLVCKFMGGGFISISLIGGVLVSLICLRQSDVKSLIAYSSVSHMALVISGLVTYSYWGFCGSFVMMIAHGLCSSGLFCLANIVYERVGSRSLFMIKGMINVVPSLSLWWFLICSCNMAAPPSLNLVGEIILISSIVSWSGFSCVSLMLMSFFGAAYSLYLYSYTQHGKCYSGMYSFYSGYVREYLLLFLHWFPLNLLVFKGEFFMFWN
uniref:NADH-ubiquinone oxidoreductase chain 4 n=1 Tax=Dermestidae sp. GENSP01 TaxID=1205804 RepID=A0A0S2MRV2_9COLE|nr:NADH deshydrogenase subunit 4 [Dermestidae sp. GENSP01]